MPFVDRVLLAVQCLDALEGSAPSCSQIPFLVCKEKPALGCAGAWGSPGSSCAAESPSLPGMCPWGPRLAAPVPAHHTQPSVDPMGGLELRAACSAPEHKTTQDTRHVPLLLPKSRAGGFPAGIILALGSWMPKSPASFFAGVVPQHRSGEEEEGNAGVQKSV